MVMVQMHVHAGYHQMLIIVLNTGELVCEGADVVVIDDRDSPDRFFIRVPLLPNQIVPNQIPDGFGAVAVALLGYQPVEVIEQMVVQGNTEPDKLLHVPSVLRLSIS
jgi:hypothetical protein